MSPPLLPSDVLPFIFMELTSRRDLYSVCLASRIFRIEGQLILFRHPGVLSMGVGDLPHNRFLDAIINSPDRLALMVRSYELSITWRPHEDPVASTPMFLPVGTSVWQRNVQESSRRKWLITRMGCALRLMANIKVLRVWNTDNVRSINHRREDLPGILRYCKFQLSSLEWDRSGEEKLIISQFLPHQTNLKELDLGRVYTGRVQDDAVLPQQLTGICLRLDSLSGSIAMTYMFLVPNDSRKRPVRCLRWTSSNSTGDSAWQWQHRSMEMSQLTGPLSRVQLLDYEFRNRNPSLAELSPMLGKLTVLRIYVDNLRWTSSSWQKDLVALGHLPALRTLILSLPETRQGRVPHLRLSTYDDATRVSEQIFLHSNSLQLIDIDGLYGHTERYTRAAPSATPSSARIGSRTKISASQEYSWSNRHYFLDFWNLKTE